MLMSESTRAEMNELLKSLFEANSLADNCAYNLDYYYKGEITEVYHHSFAHAFPALADTVSEEMLKLDSRPIRLPLAGFDADIKDLKDIFTITANMMDTLRLKVIKLIDDADAHNDPEVRIFAENFLEGSLLPFVKQSHEWLDAAQSVAPEYLNIHFKDYTHFISIVK